MLCLDRSEDLHFPITELLKLQLFGAEREEGLLYMFIGTGWVSAAPCLALKHK